MFFSKIACADVKKSYEAIDAKDYATAVIEARKAVDAGDPLSYYLLGMFYEKGLGVEADAKQAVEWHGKAVKGGVVTSASRLAWIYYTGKGVEQDRKEALRMARFGAKFNDAFSQTLVYLFLKSNQLSYLDSHGKP